MRFNRSRDDIISDILEVASGGGIATKMGIMYKTFLSHAQMKNYLTYLTQSDLLIYDGQTHTFKTTEKGLYYQVSQK
ncbi:MAG: winged helix-turn-helix domain-containing protein [Thermoproteota archaeon]|nr:winged helix-turn-helix domain-containing protein [Thermoproteota archaeon]